MKFVHVCTQFSMLMLGHLPLQVFPSPRSSAWSVVRPQTPGSRRCFDQCCRVLPSNMGNPLKEYACPVAARSGEMHIKCTSFPDCSTEDLANLPGLPRWCFGGGLMSQILNFQTFATPTTSHLLQVGIVVTGAPHHSKSW